MKTAEPEAAVVTTTSDPQDQRQSRVYHQPHQENPADRTHVERSFSFATAPDRDPYEMHEVSARVVCKGAPKSRHGPSRSRAAAGPDGRWVGRYARSPTASRASASLPKACHQTPRLSRHSRAKHISRSKDAPLLAP